MQVAYMKSKLFADGSEEIRIKISNEITTETINKAQTTKFFNKLDKTYKQERIINKINALKFTDKDYERKKRILEYELQLRNIQNVRRSANRARQNLYDVCKCNDFDFFVTFTYSSEYVDRLNDKAVKRKFTQWANDTRKRFPNMYYVATPEYHKKGGLHFHLLIGGVSFEELKCVPALKKNGKPKFKNGKQIFNVTAWKYGWSTLSVVENSEAAKHYLCKYITKQHYDDRFFNKRRYYMSHNVKRPIIASWTETPELCLKHIDTKVMLIAYCDLKKKYAVLTHDGSGLVTEPNTPQSVVALRQLAARGNPKPRVPYLTSGTLNRKPELIEYNEELDIF